MSVWDTLIGQPDVLAALQRASADERPTHAWLFTGPPGAGRETAALAFAAALLCERELGQRGCGTCRSCQTVLSGSHADFVHFRTEKTQITIDEARDFVVRAQDRPAVGRWRVMLIEDADRMPERTSNVLLKAIEEPPPHTIWLLTAPSPADVLVTIRSRCRPVNLRVPTTDAVTAALVSGGHAPEAAELAARMSQGNLEVARRLAEDEDARKRRSSVVRLPISLLTVAAAMEAADELISIAEAEADADASARNDTERAALLTSLGYEDGERLSPTHRSQLRQLEEDQKRRAKRIQTDTLDRFLADIQTVLRDVLTLQLRTDSALINAHLGQSLYDYAASGSAERTLAHLDAVAATRRRLKSNASPRLAFEAMMTGFVR
ncbi:DNA polymerase III subunit delta' [Rothia sp. (in: high G+C Gram-positive bacteria)]|uniref:DNA polymerase III subunit delta' n=1 Tax=Rothia sp. (in: high G+C Gram-positive bacteria) TaxID=1885016 RepID=UPI000EEB89F7|nr:DNA polymerase III subunit delta' [Rothia sp. (in: high G+C Gram-positive bacteria)]